jgi:hypothetical protein
LVGNHDESLSLYAATGNASGEQHVLTFLENCFDISWLPHKLISFVVCQRIA